MKKTGLILMGMIMCLASCSTKPPTFVYNTVLLDITTEDMLFQQPDTPTFTNWITPEDPNSGSLFEIAYITDFHQSNVERVELPVSNFLVNELQRKAEHKAFVKKAMQLSLHAQKQADGREQSIVFRQIALALNRHLSCQSCTEAHLYVISDLMEHNEVYMSLYNERTLNFFEAQPDSLYAYLDGTFPIQRIKDKTLTLNLIFTPVDREADQRYHRISKLLIPYYQSKGLRVQQYASFTEAISNTPKL